MSPDDSTPYVIESLGPICGQLHERLEADLSDRHWLAISTALTNAAAAGFRQGIASLTFTARQQNIDLIPHVHGVEDVDLWAERYRDDEDE